MKLWGVVLGMASSKTNALLSHYSRQTKHFSEFRFVRPWNTYVTAE